MNPFRALFRSQAEWFSVGLASSFPDLGLDDNNLSQPRVCDSGLKPGCKVFHVPRTDISQRTEVPIAADALESSDIGGDLKDQVLVFQYRGKFHAIDHQCPHSSFPLSQGTPFDIEDFGIVLSAGLTCPKHGWSFDLFSGMSDRGKYKLGVWEVQLREIGGTEPPISTDEACNTSETTETEVWVRRKQRIG
ncbi:Rieske domain-protein [Phialemonium atrogriseum]|uniref:Rieske domain-protein n=1 Tax=Phialemonium atrogriseum TaxID=1093897 RepID=A0AAJ0BTV5_9PEZI|nr:Rieske domain-protein [Phialemonium atrogriseum]KAK1763308.1 Rieske domain-protein [Phialemonium atrogriseum]